MSGTVSFRNYAIVACGTLVPELEYLKNNGFLDVVKIFYTAPGLHQVPEDLEKQLVKQINNAKQLAKKIIVVFGGTFCYVNANNPVRTIDDIIGEQAEPGYFLSRTKIHNCVDMLASEHERQEMAQGHRVWFHTPGWLKYQQFVFKGWDKVNANEYFPQYTGGAVMLDPIGFFNEYMEKQPEDILEFSDWIGLPVVPADITMDRFKEALVKAMDPADLTEDS